MNTTEFMEASGLTRWQVKNWQQFGYIAPENAEKGSVGPGHGTPLVWSEETADIAHAMRVLSEAGLTLQQARLAADYLVAARVRAPRARSHSVRLTPYVSVTVER